MNYQDVLVGTTAYDRGINATIGIQASKFVARQHSFNLASVANGTGLLFSTSSSSPNLPPVANPDSAVLAEDGFADIAVTLNDTDPEGNTLEIASAEQPANGWTEYSTFNPADTVFRYIPFPNFVGTDSFTYVVSDGRGGTSQATVSLTVTQGNDRPIARNDTAVTPQGVPVAIAVLANDTDAENDPISLVSVTQPANGSAVINANGTITYTPNASFVGTNTFTYTITDGIAGNASATVTVTVQSNLTITSISPSTVGFGVVTLTIDGTGFAAGATLSFAGGEGRVPLVNSLTVQSSTRIVASVNVRNGGPTRTRYWDVTVRLPNGATATIPDGLTVVP
jgi:hypothetical protein